ncbi:hypothetical protein BDV19DRAFT_357285 [Aspergillus venezuelensis]
MLTYVCSAKPWLKRFLDSASTVHQLVEGFSSCQESDEFWPLARGRGFISIKL